MKTAVISWRDSQSTPKERSLSTVLDICNKYSNLISEESIAYLRDVLRSLQRPENLFPTLQDKKE